tara:strand:- start:28031 stop:29047 length:1017 start_codon:yes stop_codon:yes gene_type:complete
MQLNDTNLTDRHNRPSVTEKVALRTFFLNGGTYVDPYDISGVTIFNKADNLTPASLIDGTTGLLKGDISADKIRMAYGVSGDPLATDPKPHDGSETGTGAPRVTSNYLDSNVWFPPYIPSPEASGILRMGIGDYLCVLDGQVDLSGLYTYNGSSVEVRNGASSVLDYIDVWTVKFSANSEYQCMINGFKLYNDVFQTITEPVIFTATNRLVNKHVNLGSQTDLKVTTEITVQNRTLESATKSILEQSCLRNTMFRLQKINQGTVNLPSRVTILDYADTSGYVTVTGDNTMLYALNTQAIVSAENSPSLGGVTGTYVLTCAYSILDQNYVQGPFFFEIK